MIVNADENPFHNANTSLKFYVEMGAENIPTLDVFDKVDEVDRPSSFLGISALKQHGIDQLKQVISDKLKNTMDIKVTTIPYEDHHLLITSTALLVSSTATSEGWTITYINRVVQLVKIFEILLFTNILCNEGKYIWRLR